MSGVTRLELTDRRWGDFVAGHPEATPFHHPGWAGLVAGCYGFRAFALATSDESGAIRSGLPVIEVRHLGGAPRWVSLPYTDYCPPLVLAGADEQQLAAGLWRASGSAGVRQVEVRAPLPGAAASGSPALRHVLPLDPDPAHVYAGFHHSQVQRSIRRAEREGLTVRAATLPQDLAGTYYRLHLRTRRRQGVPVQPRRFFRLLWESAVSTGLGSVVIVEAAGVPVAGAVFLAWNGTVIYKFGASDPGAWRLRPNHLLFWHAIRTACQHGYRWFDFGRTDAGQQGLRDFKLSWGAVEKPLVYGTLGGGPARIPAATGIAGRVLGPVIRRGPLLLCRMAGESLYRYTA
ncbi:MAG: GNAT family N-acetyltransferase [Actinobacteria bacterium]|nr:GNAT family N-acetyltransferase [Actinomycetota bacterium]